MCEMRTETQKDANPVLPSVKIALPMQLGTITFETWPSQQCVVGITSDRDGTGSSIMLKRSQAFAIRSAIDYLINSGAL